MLSQRMAGMIAVLLMTAPLMAQGLNFVENWDGQAVNQPPGAPWFIDPHYIKSFWVLLPCNSIESFP